MHDTLHFLKIVQYDVVYFRGTLKEFLQVLVIGTIMTRQVVLLFPRISVRNVTAVMGGDKVHSTIDFHRVGIIENRHAPAYILFRNTVMVLEQGNVRVLSHGHQFPFFHYVAFHGKRTKIILLSMKEYFLA